MRRLAIVVASLLLAACAGRLAAPTAPGAAGTEPTRHDQRQRPPAGLSYVRDVQPLLNRRCVVCHACYDAPCQLKATAWEGLARGASRDRVYDASRLLAAPTTRLFEDADRASAWRERGFTAVLDESAIDTAASRRSGVMHRLLALKARQPGPTGGRAPEALELGLDRTQSCPSSDEMDRHEARHPLAGMPYALPPLAPDEHRLLMRWLEAGAPAEAEAPLPAAVQRRIAPWERLLNGDDAKSRLFARYVYEHLFLAHLRFDDDPGRHALRLVRSSTPPGTPVAPIATRRPVDDPGIERVYYRLVPERETIVAKTHLPYTLDAARLARWRAWFVDAPYTVDRLPGYGPDDAANPFRTFAALPVDARYRFMLDEAAFTIRGFIKGPVCRGQMAVNVIEDRFWVAFMAPSPAYDQAVTRLIEANADLLRLPSAGSDTDIALAWWRYARLEAGYAKARTQALDDSVRAGRPLDLARLWNGDGHNDNAGLTVMRHFDSATVVKGFVGEPPKTAWVIGYPLLERIHYLLVADYDVWGNVGHQLNSRLYMDYLRAEGEFNWLALLPASARIAVRDGWYRGSGEAARGQVYGGAGTTLAADSAIRYTSDDPRRELMQRMHAHLAPALSTRLDWRRQAPAALAPALERLAAVRGRSLQWMPEFAVLAVAMPDGPVRQWSLVRDTGHASVSHLLGEGLELRPDEHAMTLVPGVVGAYPNAYYRVAAADLPAFVDAVAALSSGGDAAAFAARWSVQRADPSFWAFSDAVHARYAAEQPDEAGILDYNRYENR